MKPDVKVSAASPGTPFWFWSIGLPKSSLTSGPMTEV